VAITLCIRLTFPEPWATIIGCVLAVVIGLYTTRTLIRLAGSEQINVYLRRVGLSFLTLKPTPPKPPQE
jgi:hypothetical protein